MKINLDKYLKQKPFLKASDIKTATATIKIQNVREVEFNDRTAVVLDVLYNKKEVSFPLNATNLKRIINQLGDDTEKWAGNELKLIKVLVTNPKTNKEVESLRVKE